MNGTHLKVECSLYSVLKETFLKLGSWDRISLEENIWNRTLSIILLCSAVWRRFPENDACFERIEAEYYPRVIQNTCLRIAECVRFTFN